MSEANCTKSDRTREMRQTMTLPERLREIAKVLDGRGWADLPDDVRDAAAIIERLPTTADGVTVVPGMTISYVMGDDVYEFGPIQGLHSRIDWKEVYSTREAAEKARAR